MGMLNGALACKYLLRKYNLNVVHFSLSINISLFTYTLCKRLKPEPKCRGRILPAATGN